MAAALIHSIGGSQFSASACKSGLRLSPGRLAAGGVRAAFKGWPPSEGAAPHRTPMPPEHSGAKRSLGTPPAQREGPPSGSGQVSGFFAAFSSKRLGLEFLASKRLCFRTRVDA